MRMLVLKSKNGFILLWTLSIVMVFFAWVTLSLKEVNEITKVRGQKEEIKERLQAEGLMCKSFSEGKETFIFEGKHIKFIAKLENKKITVNVEGTTKYNYVYDIMEDESLVLVTTEE